MERAKKLKKREFIFIVVLVVLLIYAMSLIIPILWAFFTSFKGRGDYLANMLSLPKKWLFSNYATAFNNYIVEVGTKKVYIETMLLNSALYAVGCAFFLTFSNCIMAYAVAKFSHRFRILGVYNGIVLVTMSLPIVGSQASELQMLMNLGLYDSILGAWVMKMFFGGVYYFVFFAAFKSIPQDYADAAYIDGAGNATVLFKLMLPFVSKTFLTVMLIHFINFWNDYQVPLLYLPSHPTLAYGLYKYSASYKPAISSTPMKMAGCMILFLPIFAIFCAFQKQLMGSAMMGGIKE